MGPFWDRALRSTQPLHHPRTLGMKIVGPGCQVAPAHSPHWISSRSSLGVAINTAIPISDTLPGARAAILARLWGALVREPLPGVLTRQTDGDYIVVTMATG